MKASERIKLLNQVLWDYNISAKDIDAVLTGRKESAGHYNREKIFRKLLESYSWFTILQLIPPHDVKLLLTNQVINKLRSQSLRNKYEFVRERLHQIIPTSG